ncbi:N-6 DNA methylase [Lactococcus protaetiae]|uniref:N-6 DNA methylase n=1 Tax=Lactococcus protaetiae TaxID=2592653 RepID=A0A514ZA73_9LACT|nr:N-6 DNA methylase [Lactococcus protaetiae]QDK71479.1 N-6 DNA methylase [Lactococcus protaetiae]
MTVELIVKKIKQLDGKYRYDELFFAWIHSMAYTLSNQADLTNFDEREKKYLELFKKYGEGTLKVFSECFAELIDLFDENGIDDHLGKMYHLLNAHNSNKGQFFTPYSLSLASAKLAIDKDFLEKTIEKSGKIRIGENACGAGSMILAQLQLMKDLGVNYQKNVEVEACDLDENVLLMCYVQLSLLGVRAKCYVGNALSQEIYDIWKTPMHLIWR